MKLSKTEALGLLATFDGFSDEDTLKEALNEAGKPLASYWLEGGDNEKEELFQMAKKGVEVLKNLEHVLEDTLKD